MGVALLLRVVNVCFKFDHILYNSARQQ